MTQETKKFSSPEISTAQQIIRLTLAQLSNNGALPKEITSVVNSKRHKDYSAVEGVRAHKRKADLLIGELRAELDTSFGRQIRRQSAGEDWHVNRLELEKSNSLEALFEAAANMMDKSENAGETYTAYKLAIGQEVLSR